MEVIEKIEIVDSEFFHTDNIKSYDYRRNEKICKEFSLRDDIEYQTSRLFHRSLIKYLSGKQDIGVSIANEVVIFMNFNIHIDEVSYKDSVVELLNTFNKQYQLPLEYLGILYELIEKLNEAETIKLAFDGEK